MAAIDDLNKAVADIQAADTAIQTAVTTAVALIKSLHSGTGTVTDAQVEMAVTALEAAVGDFHTVTTSLGSATPGP